MATKVEKFQSDSGALFDSEYEALQDDLRFYLAKAAENEAIATKMAKAIIGDMDSFIALIKAIEGVRRRMPPAMPQYPGD